MTKKKVNLRVVVYSHHGSKKLDYQKYYMYVIIIRIGSHVQTNIRCWM